MGEAATVAAETVVAENDAGWQFTCVENRDIMRKTFFRTEKISMNWRTILGGLLLLFLSLNCFPQDSSPKTSRLKFKHKSKVETIYDKEKNQTTTYLRPMTLLSKESSIEAIMINEGKRTRYLPAETILVTAYIVSPGKVLVKPEFVIIAFRSSTLEKAKFTSDQSLTVTLDDVAMDLGNMTIMEHRLDDRMQVPGHQYMLESLELPVSYETFLKVTQAKKVKIRLARETFELQNDHLEAFRDLLSRVE